MHLHPPVPKTPYLGVHGTGSSSEAIKKLLDDNGLAVTTYQFTQAWKLNDLKDPAKGLAVLLGGQWFWYQEGIDRIKGIVTT